MTDLSPTDLAARIRALSRPLDPRPTGLSPAIAPLPGIRAVLFDVYGTLVVSASGDIGRAGEPDRDQAFAAALEAAGMTVPAGRGAGAHPGAHPGTGPVTETGEEPDPEPDPEPGPVRLEQAIRACHEARKAAGTAFPEVDIREMWAEVLATREDTSRLAIEYECRVNPIWPMPGMAEVLARLRARGLVLGIVSNAQFYTPLMLAGFLGAPLSDRGFDEECCAFSYRLREAKPSTAIYQLALDGLARRHGIAPGAVLYVGNDVRNDIWPASATGCRTALFAGDARSLRLREDDPCCAGVVPDRVVTDLAQITACLLPVES